MCIFLLIEDSVHNNSEKAIVINIKTMLIPNDFTFYGKQNNYRHLNAVQNADVKIPKVVARNNCTRTCSILE